MNAPITTWFTFQLNNSKHDSFTKNKKVFSLKMIMKEGFCSIFLPFMEIREVWLVFIQSNNLGESGI